MSGQLLLIWSQHADGSPHTCTCECQRPLCMVRTINTYRQRVAEKDAEIRRLQSDIARHIRRRQEQSAEIRRLRAELAECKQEWQTMETAPKDGSRILLATPSGKIADGFWSLEYRVWSWPYVMVEPTHWTRSLPIPGRKGEGE